jgi:uncharacterized DUF497 family protein
VTRFEVAGLLFEWDEEKAIANLAKHGVDFADGAIVFIDQNVLIEPNDGAEGEERFYAIGTALGLVILYVVYTERSDDGKEIIRIISARKASKKESKRYFEALSRS